MATDIRLIEDNLQGFYDFTGKTVIHVGAGGGQLIGYAGRARSVTAVDPDSAAMRTLAGIVASRGLSEKFALITGEFEEISSLADLVFFEFSLHEIADASRTLDRASLLAPEVLVVDHHPDSDWAWFMCEERKAERGWRSVCARAPVRQERFRGVQEFPDSGALEERLAPLGPTAISRARALVAEKDISIEMVYAMALISSAWRDHGHVIRDRS